MYKTFNDMIVAARSRGPKKIAVAAADDLDILLALKAAQDEKLAIAVLVGPAANIEPLIQKTGLEDAQVIDEPDPNEAALKAAELVRNGEAQVLMKGLLNSSPFLKAVLNKERGLRKNKVLSHMAVFEVPGVYHLLFMTDGGMNVRPDLEAKKEILINSLQALANMGFEKPAVAVLSHNEQVNEKMPSTTDAAGLVQMAERGELPPCVIEGPMAMDVAASSDAARHNRIESRISGAVDVFLMPNIESGKLVGKTLIFFAKAKTAGLILGAAAPVIMASRSDTPEAKLCSIALGCLSCSEVK